MALFCPDAVVWGDVGTWVTALGALLIGIAGINLSVRAHTAAAERSRREELGARAMAKAALKHCWVYLAQAERAVTPEGPWDGSTDLCASIIATMNTDAIERASDAASSLDEEECVAITEAAVAARAAGLAIAELALGSHTPYELRTALESHVPAVYDALVLLHGGSEHHAIRDAHHRVMNFRRLLQCAEGADWRRGVGFVAPDGGE